MTIEEKVVEKLRELPLDKQKRVLEFLDSLDTMDNRAASGRGIEGFLAHHNVDITDEDIADARRQMWGKFDKDSS